MNILIACEESQRVCIAFRDKGHNAFSCDILSCSGGHPELEEFICSLLQCEYCKFGTRGGCELLEWLEQPDKEGNNEAG